MDVNVPAKVYLEAITKTADLERELRKSKAHHKTAKNKFQIWVVILLLLLVNQWVHSRHLNSDLTIAQNTISNLESALSEAQASKNVGQTKCNSNYSGCVPNSNYDLNCPQIGHTVRILGVDEYDLDADGDGWGCE